MGSDTQLLGVPGMLASMLRTMVSDARQQYNEMHVIESYLEVMWDVGVDDVMTVSAQ